jgi:hypothetical protein
VYFEKPGKQNTTALLRTVKKYAESTGVRDVVVASTLGDTGVAASKLFKGYNLVVVTHFTGFSESGAQELKEENRKMMLNPNPQGIPFLSEMGGYKLSLQDHHRAAGFQTMVRPHRAPGPPGDRGGETG